MRPIWTVPLITALAFTFSGAAPAFAAGPNGECTCRYKGQDVGEGQTACIRTAKGPTLARCERVLNNTSWKFLDQPCPTARLSPSIGDHRATLGSTG